MDVLNKITKLTGEHNAQLLVVSKTYPAERIKEVYDAGQREFGENKVQEILEKKDLLPDDIQWHMIGHLQTNKVKLIVPFISMIHSVDSEKLLVEIQKHAKRFDRKVDILLQVHVAQEETKFGLNEQELDMLIQKIALQQFSHIRCRGLMGMASFSDDMDLVRSEFRGLKRMFDKVSNQLKDKDFNTLSMGMSGDYEIALEEGSTLVRVGSLIFGKRNYS